MEEYHRQRTKDQHQAQQASWRSISLELVLQKLQASCVAIGRRYVILDLDARKPYATVKTMPTSAKITPSTDENV